MTTKKGSDYYRQNKKKHKHHKYLSIWQICLCTSLTFIAFMMCAGLFLLYQLGLSPVDVIISLLS